jgi:outer membrane protein assembly factor BamB
MRSAAGSLSAALLALACAGCQTVGGIYDSWFGSSTPAQKPAELQTFTPSVEARVAWQASVGSGERFAFAPAAGAGALYAANAAGEVVKLDAASGKVEWRANTGARLSAGPGTDGRMVVVGSPRGELLALDASGKLIWKAYLSGEILSAPQLEESTVAVKSGDGRIFGLSAQDGRRRWIYQRSLPALTVRSPAGITVTNGGVVSGFPGGKLVALLLNNGVLAWEATVATPRGSTELERITDIVGAPLVDGRTVCAIAYQGRMGCFDALKGTQVWVRDLSSTMPLAADRSYLYASDDNGYVHAFDKATGASIWRQEKLFARGVTGAAAVSDRVAVGDYQGYVHFLDRRDGALAARVATDGSAILLPPLALRDAVVVQTRNGGLFAIRGR